MVRYRIKWSVEAKLDLQNVLAFYNIRNQSNAYSKKLLGRVRKLVGYISINPLIGRSTDIENVRMFILGAYQIIYEIKEPRQIFIIMFWDCRRNPENRKIEMRQTPKISNL